MKRFLLGIALLLFSALHAEAAVDRVCNYTVGSTTTAQGFANCTEEVADLSKKAFAIATSASNTGNAISIVTSPAVTTLSNGQAVIFTSPVTISGAATFQLDGTTAASLYQLDGTTALGSGDIVSGATYMLSYKSSTGRWLLMGTPGTGAAPASAAYVTIGNTASLATERALTAGNCITLTDGGVNSTATLAVASCTSSNLASGLTDETGSGAAVFATSPTLVTPNLGTPSAATLTNATGLPITTGVSGLGTGVATFLGTPSSANLAAATTDETGSGALVFATSPTFVTPALGTPASGTLTNATGLPISTGVSGLGTGVATFLATPTTANFASAVTGETGTGAVVFGTSPSLTTPAIGSGGFTIAGSSSGTTTIVAAAAASGTVTVPSATDTLVGKATTDTLTNKSISLGSNTLTTTSAQLATATSDETGSGALVFATSPTFVTPALGTPSSGTLTNATGLPISTGVSGLGTGIATALATPSSANWATAFTDESGSGSIAFTTSPTFTTPNLGTPSAATLTNATGLPISTGVSGLGTGVATALAVARNSNGGMALQSGTPTVGNCVRWAVGGGIDDAGGTCGGGGGGGSPGGASGTIQYNNGGAFGGFTASGDATINTSTGAVTIANNAVTNAKAAQMAANTIKGNNTGGSADASDLTATQTTAMLNAMVGDSGSGGTKGLVPAPSAGDAAANKYLKADGTWTAITTSRPYLIDTGIAQGTTNLTFTSLPVCTSLKVMYTQFHSTASGTTQIKANVSDDNGSTWGSDRSIGASLGSTVPFALQTGAVNISGTGATSTNKVFTPQVINATDIDAGSGNATSYTTTATETTKTGVTNAIRFNSGGNFTYSFVQVWCIP